MPFSTIHKRGPKPRRHSSIWRIRPAVITYPGGREICNPVTAEGIAEYRGRVAKMHKRQTGLCCNCRKPLALSEATFEHEDGRGGGKRDDRIVVNGKPKNGASHGICNSERGSKRTPIWHGPVPEGGK